MRYWLMKSEPDDVFSIDDLAGVPRTDVAWFGVRNYQARNFMRDQMQVGDLAFFYHSSCPEPGIAGIVRSQPRWRIPTPRSSTAEQRVLRRQSHARRAALGQRRSHAREKDATDFARGAAHAPASSPRCSCFSAATGCRSRRSDVAASGNAVATKLAHARPG